MKNLYSLLSGKAKSLLFFSVLLAAGFPLLAEVIYIEDMGFVIDLPIGWEVMDVTESRYTFNDFTGDAFLQLKMWPGDKYDSAEGMFDLVGQDIGASGEGDSFDFYGREAVFASIDFISGDFDYSGYGLFADGEDYDLTILAFASSAKAEQLADYLLSALDSFSLSPGLMFNPGPVSRYYLESYESPERVDAVTAFEGVAVEWQIDNHAVEASQLVIEREAAVLSDYKPQTEAGTEAWKRYYRMVYRDTYSRLDYPAALLKERLKASPGQTLSTEAHELETAERLLSWVQLFSYRRTGGSDLISPFSAAAFQEGDCDSRSLLYIILLNHYGIDSALMVSSIYSHAMAAVDVEARGAKIRINNRDFTVAETTDDVDIGMIAADMADPANWIIIPLMEKEPWN
ncbi:MAG: hypothetical protein JEZ04_04385 [Spirochaetales bacterium]|nr:hypothetical protein [Spirochaetales bacterium]